MQKCEFSLKRDRETAVKRIALICMAVSVFLFILLLSKITAYSDDYHFGTVFDYDFSRFCDQTFSHYLESNGRLLVHFLLELTLLADTKIYMFLCPAVVVLCAYLICAICNQRVSLIELSLSVSVSILLLLGLPTVFLSSSVLWMSGSFNFVLPLAFVLVAIFFYSRSIQDNSVSVCSVIFCFLAGATTEQYGFYVCIAVWGIWIMALGRKAIRFRKFWIAPLFALIGYLTVLLAPGMWGRVDNETLGFWSFLDPQLLRMRFFEISVQYFDWNGCGIFVVLFVLLSASLIFSRRKYPRLLVLGYPVAVFLACANGIYAYYSGYVLFFYLLFLGILFVSRREHTALGCIILGSLGTQLLLLITAVYGYRTTMPLVFTLVLLSAYFLLEILRGRNHLFYFVVLMGIAVFSFGNYIDTYRGYDNAKIVLDENIEAMKECQDGGELHLSLDVDPYYGYTPFYENEYFYYAYLEYYEVDYGKTEIYLDGKDYVPFYIDGKIAKIPCYVDDNGAVYVPLLDLAESFGAYHINYEEKTVTYQINDLKVYQKTDPSIYKTNRLYSDADYENLIVDESDLLTLMCSFAFLSDTKAEELFGIEVVYDEENQCCVVKE